MKYIVYQYTFPDGKVYIGRSREDQPRIGNIDKYKEQYVYKIMKKYEGKFEIDILYETENIFTAFAVEHKFIDIHFNHSYNASVEYDWFDKALYYLHRYVHPTPEEVAAMLQEYTKIKLIIPVPTKKQVIIK